MEDSEEPQEKSAQQNEDSQDSQEDIQEGVVSKFQSAFNNYMKKSVFDHFECVHILGRE